MKGLRYVDHTADIAFIANGRSIEECIENACAAMLNAMLDVPKVNRIRAPVKSIMVNESADSLEYLTWFTLEHVLEEVDEKALNAFEFRVDRLFEVKKKHSLHGRLYYKDADDDCRMLSIKAVTPHGMKLTKKAGKYSIKVTADV